MTRKLVALSPETVAAVERYRRSSEMRRHSIARGLPSESETLRRLITLPASWQREAWESDELGLGTGVMR